MANARYIKILTLLRGLRDKIFHDSVVSDSQKKNQTERKKENRTKCRKMTKPPSHVRILTYRSWAT